MSRLEKLRKKLDSLLSKVAYAETRVRDLSQEVEKSKSHLENTEEARKLLQEVAEGVQEQAHSRIAEVVTKCLAAVFGGDAPGFKINFSRKRGRTEAEMVFVTSDGKEVAPLEESGGGMVDVAGFALRLAALVLSSPARSKILVADEPLKHLSHDFRPAAREMVSLMSAELGVQIVMVTHSRALRTGRVVRLRR